MTLELEGGENLSVDFFSSKIQNIVNNNHKIDSKKKLRYYPTYKPKRINFACPYCGDSQKVNTKYRGNVWLNSMMYTCFNCGTKKSFPSFCNDFNENIDLEDKIKIYNYLDDISYSNDDFSVKSMDKLIDLKEWLDFMNNHKKSWLSDISPIQKNSRAYQYLTLDRNLYNHKFIYQGIYRKWRGDKCYWQSPVIINLNVSNDKLLGIQLRNLEKDRNKRFYKIIEFDEIYNFINPQKPIDDIESITYNKLSHFYNILNVDFDDYVTIFEGFLDSLFYPNSIGMVGANNDEDLLKFLISADEDLKLRFFYDNDQDGNRKATKMLDRGYSIFLWKKLFNDIVDKSSNKYLMEKKLEKIIDLNDLVLFYNDNKIYDNLNLKDYFSIDLFDKIYLDNVKKIF